MENGYKILWTDNALEELDQTVEFLETNWTVKELRNFASKLDHILEIISKSPEIFPADFNKKEIRKAVVDKNNTLYYRTKGITIEVISLFSNRQNPKKKSI